ncbi:DUF1806 family protein [Xylanibacillus composti]|uniref:DUF1806 family protein n=1 Tax=Xylanibacillus composti TaxID=1572762 RepID=A0A8J4H700_9BACL|nr:DUF1806 family protein [Xylanibacillus composti]MDT9726926.1 DUF1806 family protein [Xylanibacillus composti]GIQ70104.1 hypothetical protein XYCOK13_29280 [Xylanibacillus composti]
MQTINKSDVVAVIQNFTAQDVYIHSEATSFVFVRNFRAHLTDCRIAGEGPYRVGMRFDGHGWLRMEGLTHYEVDADGRLLLAGYDDEGRMHVALELGKEPFPE